MSCPRLLAVSALLVSSALFAQNPPPVPVDPLQSPPSVAPVTTPALQPPEPAPVVIQQPAPTPNPQQPVLPAQAGENSEDTKDTKDIQDASKRAPAADRDKPVNAAQLHHPLLWHDPGNVEALDLFNGQGGAKGKPEPPFTFEEEDMHGSNPKFDARDAKDKKWRVKLGEEARPEVVASRLLWAAGFYVNDDYVLDSAEIQGLHMKRTNSSIVKDKVSEARFARKPPGQKKIGIWLWKKNPFTGTKEFNGLRVMMAVMNNWDLKDGNNAVFANKDSEFFLTSDVGATFGTNGLSWTRARSKGNIESFKGSKFIDSMTAASVDFATPKPPTATLAKSLGFSVVNYAKRAGMGWIGQNIPRADAKWMGSILGQLSHQQLVDAFRAGHFPPGDVEAYVNVVETRIQELQNL